MPNLFRNERLLGEIKSKGNQIIGYNSPRPTKVSCKLLNSLLVILSVMNTLVVGVLTTSSDDLILEDRLSRIRVLTNKQYATNTPRLVHFI